MSGPLHRFWAMRRWWSALAILIVLNCLVMLRIPAERLEWIALAVLCALILVPLVALMVLLPRLRGGFLAVFALVFMVSPVHDLPATWSLPLLIAVVFVIILVASRVMVPLMLSGSVRIESPIHEVALAVRCRETKTHWHALIDRIEHHPDTPGLWRVHTRGTIHKAVPSYTLEVIEEFPNGGSTSRAQADNPKVWRGAETTYWLETDGAATIVHFREQSRTPLLGAIKFWLDRVGDDALHMLRCHVEGRADWSITAGDGRWWPSWRLAPEAAVF